MNRSADHTVAAEPRGYALEHRSMFACIYSRLLKVTKKMVESVEGWLGYKTVGQ